MPLPVWADLERLVVDCARGARRADGTVDSDLVANCSLAYDRSLFFVPSFLSLRGLAEPMRRLAEASGLVPDGEVPGRGLISAATAGVEPISLAGILKITRTLRAVQSAKPRSLAAESLQFLINERFSGENVLGPESIVPSLHMVNLDVVEKVRLNTNLDRDSFSEIVMDGVVLPRGARRYFFRHLEEGYQSVPGGPRGVYKITQLTAEAVYKGLSAVRMSGPTPDLDEVAQVDAFAGPRNGQMSRGLPRTMGNLLPDRFNA